MSSRRLIAILAVLAAGVLAIVCFLGLDEVPVAPDPTMRPSKRTFEEPIDLASPADARSTEARFAAATSTTPTSPAPDASPAALDIVALFEQLELDEGYFFSFRASQGFRKLDLSSVRNLVRIHELSVDQLLDAAARDGVALELQPALILATAYCSEVHAPDLHRLLAIADVDPSEPYLQTLSVRQGVPYAALRALWMLSADDQLQKLAHRALPRYLEWTTDAGTDRPMFVRDSAALALEAIAVAEDDALREQIRRVLEAEPTMVMTPAAWGLHARSADRDEQFNILERAFAVSGYARVGMEELVDEACAPALHDLIQSAPLSVWGSYVRRSACVALFNIATPAAWQSFERVLLDAEPQSDAWIALSGVSFDFPPRPQNLANMLECVSRWKDAGIQPDGQFAIRASIERTRATLDRCTVPRRIVDQTCANLRSLVPKFSHDDVSLGVALYVLAEHGQRDDEQFVRRWLPKLSAESRRQIESHLSSAR